MRGSAVHGKKFTRAVPPHPLPRFGSLLRITQQELGYLVGLSRQRVNEALHALQQAGLIRVEYGGLRLLDLEGLRRHVPS